MLSSTDYSNTIFYKIYCKDVNIPDVYVGHTTDFVQRKRAHKNSCHNPSYPVYNCKLYTTIRRLGGWDNWNMDIIAFHKCNDQYDARKREQEYFVSLGATLNSIEPLPTPAEKPLPAANLPVKSRHVCDACNYSCFNTLDVFNLHFTSKKHLKAVNNVEKDHAKYYCEKCHYDTHNKTNFNKHLQTDKHRAQECTIHAPSCNTIYTCKCNNTYKHRQSYNRHVKMCIVHNGQVNILEPDDEVSLPPTQMVDTSLVMELLKQNQEFKELMMLQSKQLAEQQLHNTLLLEAVIPLRHAI